MKYLYRMILVLIPTVAFTACSAVGTPSVDQIVERLQSAQQQPMHGVVETTFTDPQGQTQSTVF